MKKKMWGIMGSLLGATVVIVLCIYFFSGETIADIAPAAAEHCIPSAQERGSCCHIGDGDTYILAPIGFLYKNGKILTTRVTTMLPIGDGIAFTRNNDLYYMCNGNTSSISAEAEAYSQYKETLVYAKDGIVYQWKNSTSSSLIYLLTESIYWLAGNDSYLAIGCSDGLYVYCEGELTKQEDIRIGSGEQYFLYEQFLVLFGEGETGVTVCDLSNNTTSPIDLGWKVYGDDTLDLAVTCSGSNIYFSIKAVYLPDYDNTLRKGTFCIDPTTWETKNICDEYFAAILYGENGLYSLDTLKLRGSKIF